MNFKSLLRQHSWLSIEAILFDLYPDEENNSSGYREVYEKLLLLHAGDSQMSIVVKNCKDDFDGEEYVDVSGIHQHPQSQEERCSYAIEFRPWKEWLGMQIHPNSLSDFSELEIIAHCLYEMTFVGFKEEDIQEELQRINQISEDYKNMSDEEKKANTTSLDDIIEELKHKPDNNQDKADD
jgi:hypothetical protein